MPGVDALRHDEEGHRRDANRAVAVSAVGLALTGGLELLLAVFTGSVALLGDALHNLSDVSTSAVVFLGFRISKRPPSAAYPYGYERAEDLAGLGVALVIWLSAIFAGYESYLKFIRNAGTSHIGIGIAGAAVGIWVTSWSRITKAASADGSSRRHSKRTRNIPGSTRSRHSERSSVCWSWQPVDVGEIRSPVSSSRSSSSRSASPSPARSSTT